MDDALYKLTMDPVFLAGMGLLSGNQVSTRPGDPFGSAMRNMLHGAQLQRGVNRDSEVAKLRELQMQMQQQHLQRLQDKDAFDRQQREEQRMRTETIRSTLDPNQVALFDANPAGYITQMQNRAFEKPNNNNLINDDGTINWQLVQAKGAIAQAGRDQNNFNMPGNAQIKGDYAITVGEDGEIRASVIPGTETYLKQQQQGQQAAARQESQKETGSLLTEELRRAKSLIQDSPRLTTGFFGDMLKDWGGTDASDLSGLLDTINANTGFEYLQQMRANSPTGGALGNVSDNELRLLTATKGSLRQSQSADQLLYNIERMERVYDAIVNYGEDAALKAYNGEPYKPGMPSAPAGGAAVQSQATPQERPQIKFLGFE